jgi:hypothetical protein
VALISRLRGFQQAVYELGRDQLGNVEGGSELLGGRDGGEYVLEYGVAWVTFPDWVTESD